MLYVFYKISEISERFRRNLFALQMFEKFQILNVMTIWQAKAKFLQSERKM